MHKEKLLSKRQKFEVPELLRTTEKVQDINALSSLWRVHQLVERAHEIGLPDDSSKFISSEHPAQAVFVALQDMIRTRGIGIRSVEAVKEAGRALTQSQELFQGKVIDRDAQLEKFVAGLLAAMTDNADLADPIQRHLLDHLRVESQRSLVNRILAQIQLEPDPSRWLSGLHAQDQLWLNNALSLIVTQTRKEYQYVLSPDFGKVPTVVSDLVVFWFWFYQVSLILSGQLKPADFKKSPPEVVEPNKYGEFLDTFQEFETAVVEKKLLTALATESDLLVAEWESLADQVQSQVTVLDTWVAKTLLVIQDITEAELSADVLSDRSVLTEAPVQLFLQLETLKKDLEAWFKPHWGELASWEAISATHGLPYESHPYQDSIEFLVTDLNSQTVNTPPEGRKISYKERRALHGVPSSGLYYLVNPTSGRLSLTYKQTFADFQESLAVITTEAIHTLLTLQFDNPAVQKDWQEQRQMFLTRLQDINQGFEDVVKGEVVAKLPNVSRLLDQVDKTESEDDVGQQTNSETGMQ